ncbi:MAG: CDP-alcohol phosphatidyltransferase family protein [Rubripirellula sp.]
MNRDSHQPLATPSSLQKCMAWGVHLFTACGVICCLLAIEATYAMQWRTALIWLVVGVAIDAIDGTLARLVRVNEVLPAFDGALLDNVIDFANYVIVPALILHRASLLPPSVSLIVASAICLASAYQFCQADAKTTDHYFRGFPSYWNVTVLYLLALHLPDTTNLAIIVSLIALVFVPIKYIYVTRTLSFQKLTLTLTMAWSGMMLVILWQLPDPNRVILYASLIYVAYYASMSVYLTFRKPKNVPTTD